MDKLFKFCGQNIDVSDKNMFGITYMVLNDEEGRNTTLGDPLTEYQRQTCHFYTL